MSCLLSPHPHHSEPIKARKSRNQNEGDYTLQPKAWEACWGQAWVCRVMYLPSSHWVFAASAQSCPSGGTSTENRPFDLASEPWPGGASSSVQSLSRVQLFVTPWTIAARPSCPSPTPGVYSNLRPSSQWYHPTISFSLVPCFSISPSNEYSGLISVMIDWFDLLAVQGTLKSFLQHNSKASILQHSAFFTV